MYGVAMKKTFKVFLQFLALTLFVACACPVYVLAAQVDDAENPIEVIVEYVEGVNLYEMYD